MIYCRLRGHGMDLVWTYNGSLGTGFRERGLWTLDFTLLNKGKYSI